MKVGKIGFNILKIAILVGISSLVVRMILGWYYGYRHINGFYAGPYYYYWRVNFVDSKLSKTFYNPVPLNNQPHDDVFFKFLDYVQGTSKKHALSYDYDKRAYEYGDRRMSFPYYAYGFTDAFVYPPNKNWMLFKNKPEYLDLELKYLDFQGSFIAKFYNFTEEDFEKYYSPKNKGAFLRKGCHFNQVKSTDEVLKFFNEHKSWLDASLVSKIILNIINKKSDYNVLITENKAIMGENLQTDVMSLVESIFPKMKITIQGVNDFFYRVAVIKMTPIDAHILNRIYTFCRLLFTPIDIPTGNVVPLDDLVKETENIIEEIKSGKLSKSMVDRKERKVKILSKKCSVIRSEIMFVKISQLFASLYGNGKFIISPDKDNRSFLEKIGSLKLATTNNFKKKKVAWKGNTDLLNNEISSLIASYIG